MDYSLPSMTSQERQGYEELYNNVWSYESVSNLNNLTNGVHTFTPEMMATPQSQLRGPYEPYEGMSRCPTDPNANNSINGVDKTIPMFPPDLEAILERLNSLCMFNTPFQTWLILTAILL